MYDRIIIFAATASDNYIQEPIEPTQQINQLKITVQPLQP